MTAKLLIPSLFVAVTVGTLAAPAASARDYTPDISAFYNVCNGVTGCTPGVNEAGFRDFVTQISEAMSAQFMGPANTLGYKGFEITLGAGFTPVDAGGDAWTGYGGTQPAVARNPGKLFYTNQLRFRKGLPYSIQIGGSITHMYESSLWGIGLDLSWSFVEGYRRAPDVAIVVSLGTILGMDDLLTFQMNAALVISKSFSVAGLFSFEPYVAYNLLFTTAGTHLTTQWSADGYGGQFAVDPEYILRHRAEIGMNAVIENFVVGGGMTVDFMSARVMGAVKVGVRFW